MIDFQTYAYGTFLTQTESKACPSAINILLQTFNMLHIVMDRSMNMWIMFTLNHSQKSYTINGSFPKNRYIWKNRYSS